MTDRYITSSQYEKGIRKMKEYVDKSMPYIDVPEVIFTIPVNTALEIFNSEAKAMEFDKPSNININYEFIVIYNNKDINSFIEEDEVGKCIRYIDDNIDITFIPGYDINDNVNENKMVVGISRLKSNTITTDIVLKQVKVKYLNNKYLKKDVAIKNSITVGTRNAADAIGQYSFSSGKRNTASGNNSHAEGFDTVASGEDSHAEGFNTTASGEDAHAEGYGTTALGESSHAEGNITLASGLYSHAEGDNTIAKGRSQHAEGKFNVEDTANAYAHIVGNGSSNTARSNAHTLDWSGNAWYAGDVFVGGNGQDDTNVDKLATEEYVNNSILLEMYDGIPYTLTITEDEMFALAINGTIVSSSITEEIFTEISNSKTLDVYVKRVIDGVEQKGPFIKSLKYDRSYSDSHSHEFDFSLKNSYPGYNETHDLKYVDNDITKFCIIKNKDDGTFTIKHERMFFDTLSIIEEMEYYSIENDKNKYVSVSNLETKLYNIRIDNDDIGFILQTNIGDIDMYSLYGNNVLISCTVTNDNVKLVLPDRIITGTKNNITLDNTNVTMFSDSVKQYVDERIAASRINMCTDEEITNMLTEVLGAGYSATE